MEINNLLLSMRSYFKVNSDVELAAALGVSHQVVSQWRKRAKIPLGKLMDKFPDIPWSEVVSGSNPKQDRNLEIENAHLKGEVAALERQLDKYITRIEATLRRCEQAQGGEKNSGVHVSSLA